MTGYSFLRLAFILALIVTMATLPIAHETSSYGTGGSWAVGVVVPENSALAGGGHVDWNSVSNVSVMFNLPNISVTDGTIYTIMSLMTENGSIMQVAAGLYPNSSNWSVYAMYILNPNSYPQVYRQVIVPREIVMLPGDMISMSIYFSGMWRFTVHDLTRNTSAMSYFNVSLPAELKDGDQYVFALESYSFNSSVFQLMSNMTLRGLFLNGRKVYNGWYLYTTWNNENFPLFIVGGATPPSFISASFTGNGTVTWSFVSAWSTEAPSPIPFYLITDMLAAAAIINVSVLAMLVLKRRKKQTHFRENL